MRRVTIEKIQQILRKWMNLTLQNVICMCSGGGGGRWGWVLCVGVGGGCYCTCEGVEEVEPCCLVCEASWSLAVPPPPGVGAKQEDNLLCIPQIITRPPADPQHLAPPTTPCPSPNNSCPTIPFQREVFKTR